jgi:hypothetical protein
MQGLNWKKIEKKNEITMQIQSGHNLLLIPFPVFFFFNIIQKNP